MRYYLFWLIIGCSVPIFSFSLLPLFGITGNYTLVIAVIVIITGHLLMPMNPDVSKEDTATTKIKNSNSHNFQEIHFGICLDKCLDMNEIGNNHNQN